jgi:SRSO17 transposase
MDQVEFERVATSFGAFHRRFASFFGRKEAQWRSEQYLRGLLVQQTDRRNAENIAESIAGATPRALQRLLTQSPWPTEPVIEALQEYLGPRLNTPQGVFVVDDTGFLKQGKKSVGVARQYTGTAGKVCNCQVGVFLAYVSDRGHGLVDKRLYLPKAWTEDPKRCREASVPEEVGFQTKAELGLAMLAQARAASRLRGQWVTADEAYGQVPSFRDTLDRAGWWYVLEVPCTTQVFLTPVATVVPSWSGQGRKPARPRLVEGGPRPQSVKALATALEPGEWQEMTVAQGAQGPRRYQFARQRIWESRHGLPGRESWLMLRRNLDGSELKYYFSNGPATTPLQTLGRVGALRWSIETEFETEKGETGLDEYEVRSWVGWQHHIPRSRGYGHTGRIMTGSGQFIP